jgi:hypothetical protein
MAEHAHTTEIVNLGRDFYPTVVILGEMAALV